MKSVQASETRAVLADLYEEVTGDLDKRLPPEWMAMQIQRSNVPVGVKQAALDLSIEAGGNAVLTDFALYPVNDKPVWIEADRSPWWRLFIDITKPVAKYALEVRIRNPEAWTVFFFRLKRHTRQAARAYINRIDRTFFNERQRKLMLSRFISDDPWDQLVSYMDVGATLGFARFDHNPYTLDDAQMRRLWNTRGAIVQ